MLNRTVRFEVKAIGVKNALKGDAKRDEEDDENAEYRQQVLREHR